MMDIMGGDSPLTEKKINIFTVMKNLSATFIREFYYIVSLNHH